MLVATIQVRWKQCWIPHLINKRWKRFFGSYWSEVTPLFPDGVRMVLPFLTSCSVRPGLIWLKQNLLCHSPLFNYHPTVVEMQVLNKYKLQTVTAERSQTFSSPFFLGLHLCLLQNFFSIHKLWMCSTGTQMQCGLFCFCLRSHISFIRERTPWNYFFIWHILDHLSWYLLKILIALPARYSALFNFIKSSLTFM